MIEKFKEIFSGLDRAHGVYKKGDTQNGVKQKGKAFIKKEPVTDELWQKHLDGEESLGIIPVRDAIKDLDGEIITPSTCSWGCIDIDTYPLDHGALIKKIRDLNLPLIVCRSKSGGAHLFIFTSEPVEAKILKDKLEEIAALLGYADCEVFPKQIEILADRGDTGNFLNLPYFNGLTGMRYAFNDRGEALDLPEFFDMYDTYVQSAEQISQLKIESKKQVDELEDGPPCLQMMMSLGIPEGGRDNALFQYAVYAKKKWPDDWQNKLDEFNLKYMQPPLASAQIQKTVRQHERNEYQYKCKDQPMKSHCASSTCRFRKFGIGGDFQHEMSDLTKYQSDESQWFLNIDGRRLSLNTKDLYDQNRFIQSCMDQLNIIPNRLNPRDWIQRLQELIANVEIIEMPKEITKEGRFDSLLDSFLGDQGEAMNIEEIHIGKAWFEEGMAYFKLNSLQDFLSKKQFKDFTTTQMSARIKQMGGGDTRKKIKNKTVFMWFVPYNKTDKLNLETPDMEESLPF